MISLIDIKLHKLGSFLDKTLLKKSTRYNFFCVFFDFTSRITNFFLFHRFGYPLFLFFIGIFIHYYFETINIFFLNIKLFGFSKIFDIFLSMPFGFQFSILFVFIFYEIIFINTILAYSEKINFFMKNKYHENIMKDLHYNSGLSSAIRSLVPATAAVCIFCGKDAIEAFKVKTISNDWKEVSHIALANGKPIPEHPVKIIVHTTTINNTTITTPNVGIFDNK